jgi:hypothetical protein
MGYDAILTHAHYTRESAGLRRVGSAAIRSGPVVSPWSVAARSRPHAGSERHRSPSLVSRLASSGATRAQRGRPGWSEAATRPRRPGAGGTGPAARRPGAWLPDGSLDLAPRGDRHRARHGRTVPSWARLVSAPCAEVVRPAPGAAIPRTQRDRGHRVEEHGLAARKKNGDGPTARPTLHHENRLSSRRVRRSETARSFGTASPQKNCRGSFRDPALLPLSTPSKVVRRMFLRAPAPLHGG